MPTGCLSKEKPKRVVFEPIDDRVVVTREPNETESPGGIVLPEGATEKPQLGDVLACGPNVKQASIGDRVLFSPYAETVTLYDVEYVLVKEGDLYAILK